MNSRITSIFFDVGNTLLFPNHERIHESLTALGKKPDPEHLRDLERRTKNKFDSLITNNGSHDHSFWWMFYTQLLQELGIDDNSVRDQLVSGIRNSANWDRVLPGTCKRLLEIGEQYRIGVISNADGKIEQVLAKCEIAHCFLTITDSGLVGFEKPRPEIFRHALASLNVKPQESLYVGDVYAVDYLGATAAGMQAILMDVSGAYRDKGVPRVESLEQLQSLMQNP